MLAMLNPPLVPRPPCTFPKTAEDDAVFRTTLRVPTTTLSIEQYPQIDGALLTAVKTEEAVMIT